MSITEFAGKLKLPYIRDNWQQLVDEAKTTKQDYSAFLENLLDCEWRLRMSNGQVRRIKEAKFPLKKYLVDFMRSKYDDAFLPKFEELETLEFIKNKENIILIGTPGAGKTHYAIALGISACMKGHSVLFAAVPNLIVELKEAMSSNQLNNFRKRFEKYDLVILDELGYVSMDKTGCEMFFNLISSRNDKGSIVITSNLTFDRWEEVFKDPTLTGALIDRLAHKAHVLDISREKGGRFEETLAWLGIVNPDINTFFAPASRHTCKTLANSSTLWIVPLILISPKTARLERVGLPKAQDASAMTLGKVRNFVIPIPFRSW